jgi:hypothetical protein
VGRPIPTAISDVEQRNLACAERLAPDPGCFLLSRAKPVQPLQVCCPPSLDRLRLAPAISDYRTFETHDAYVAKLAASTGETAFWKMVV